MLSNAGIFAHLTKVSANSIMLMELPGTTLVHVIKDIWAPTVLSLYVLAIVTMQEYAQLQTHVLAIEGEWVPIVRLIVDAEDMELVILMQHVVVIQDSCSILLPKNANLAALAKQVQAVMDLVSYPVVQDVLEELAIMVHANAGLDTVGIIAQHKRPPTTLIKT